MSFNYLRKLEVKVEHTAEFELDFGLDVNPVLIVRPATDANEPYRNECMRREGRVLKKRNPTNKDALRIIDLDRILFPKYIVVDWQDMPDDNGNTVPYTPENCEQFFSLLPLEFMIALRAFCSDPRNFTQLDPQDVAKKSPPDSSGSLK